jgi:hypothetical protein
LNERKKALDGLDEEQPKTKRVCKWIFFFLRKIISIIFSITIIFWKSILKIILSFFS